MEKVSAVSGLQNKQRLVRLGQGLKILIWLVGAVSVGVAVVRWFVSDVRTSAYLDCQPGELLEYGLSEESKIR